MPEPAGTIQEKPNPDTIPTLWCLFVLLTVPDLLQKVAQIPIGIGLAIGFFLARLAFYRIERQAISFRIWMFRNLTGALVFLVSLWLGPKLLSRWIEIRLCYSIYL